KFWGLAYPVLLATSCSVFVMARPQPPPALPLKAAFPGLMHLPGVPERCTFAVRYPKLLSWNARSPGSSCLATHLFLSANSPWLTPHEQAAISTLLRPTHMYLPGTPMM